MPKVLCTLAAAIFLTAIPASQGYASTIPYATGYSESEALGISGDYVESTGVPSSATSIDSGGLASGSASVSGGPHILFSASAHAEKGPGWDLLTHGGGTTEATHYMEIIGASNTSVPFVMSYSLTTSGYIGNALGDIGFNFNSMQGDISVNQNLCSYGGCRYSMIATAHLLVPANELLILRTFATAWAGVSQYFDGDISFEGDINFYIDPEFADAGQYSLAFSPNETPSPVPLPAALPLFGSVTLGFAAFAKRKGKSDLAGAA